MHALAAQGSEQKKKACINFTRMNLFSKWYCNGNTLSHNWNLWTSNVIILVQCIICSWFSKVLLFLFFTTINSPNLYATWLIYVPNIRSNYKNRLEFPFKSFKNAMESVGLNVKTTTLLLFPGTRSRLRPVHTEAFSRRVFSPRFLALIASVSYLCTCSHCSDNSPNRPPHLKPERLIFSLHVAKNWGEKTPLTNHKRRNS